MFRPLGAHIRACGIVTGLLFTTLLVFHGTSDSQQLTGSLSGTTFDQSGAVIPNAQVIAKNAASGDTRNTVSNNAGYFTFPALPPGTYDVTVSAPGFRSWQQNGITLNQGDNRTLPNIALQVGQANQQVEVVAGAEAVAPVDTGEVATTLNSEMVNDLAIQGRDAGEFFKIMPGMAFTNGLSAGSSFSDRVVSSNTGPIGAYSANGTQPNGAIAYMLDGANLVDPGNQGTQIANINVDMTSEIKVLMSGYDAAYAKGPVVFQAYGKSGGSQFHGEAYLYARNNIFNSLDSFQKSQGVLKPDAYEYYPGGNIGGPVLLPWLKFNRNRDKLFFWVGYEYMRQQPAGQLWQTFVPTTDMRNGNFSQQYLSTISALPGNHSAITEVPCPAAGNDAGTGTRRRLWKFDIEQRPDSRLDDGPELAGAAEALSVSPISIRRRIAVITISSWTKARRIAGNWKKRSITPSVKTRKSRFLTTARMRPIFTPFRCGGRRRFPSPTPRRWSPQRQPM